VLQDLGYGRRAPHCSGGAKSTSRAERTRWTTSPPTASSPTLTRRGVRATFYWRMDRARKLIGGALEEGWQSSSLHLILRFGAFWRTDAAS
jgi:hypothetical protein